MRHVLGMSLDTFTVSRPKSEAPTAEPGAEPAAPDQVVPVKEDPTPTLDGLDGTVEPVVFRFTVPAYDLQTSNRLVAITVVLLEAGFGSLSTADEWMASSYPRGTVDTSSMIHGQPVVLEVPDLPDADFSGRVIFSYEE